MEEEKKEETVETTENVETNASSEVKEEKVEEAATETIETLDEPEIETLDDPEPVESLDEPSPEPAAEEKPAETTTEAPAEPAPSPEPAPAADSLDDAPPIVHKVEDSPIANAEEPKKEEPAAPPKEEPKKEEPKKDEKPKQKSKLPIILGIGVVLIIGVVIFRLTLGGGFGSNEPKEEPKKEEPVTPPQEVKTYTVDNATKLIEDLLVFDKIDNKAGAIEMYTKNTTVNATDLTNDQVFLIVYNKYFKDKREITLDDFKKKVDSTFADYAYTPASFTPECQTFHMNYDEAGTKFTRVDFNGMCGFETDEKFAFDGYKVEDTSIDGETLSVTVRVYFGRGDNAEKEATHYFDYERTVPVETGIVVMNEGKVDVNATDFSRAAKYIFTFKEIEKDVYAFVKAELG